MSEVNFAKQLAGASMGEIQEAIAALNALADDKRRIEVAGVIANIKAQIATYDLKVSDLFGNGGSAQAHKSYKRPKHAFRIPANTTILNPETGYAYHYAGKKRPDWLKRITSFEVFKKLVLSNEVPDGTYIGLPDAQAPGN